MYISVTNIAMVKKLLNWFDVPTPSALSADGWRKHHELYNKKFIVKTMKLVDGVCNFCLIPFNFLTRITSYIKCRYVTKTHYLNTKLPKGKYHEFETRVLYGVFNAFADFIELEKGLDNIHEEINSLDQIEGIWENRKPHLRWELAAYNWWTQERPNRVDSYVASGLNEYYNKSFVDLLSFDSQELNMMFKKMDEIEQRYYDEDTKWLNQLINRRNLIWT